MALQKYFCVTILLQFILTNRKFTKAYNNQIYLDSRCSNNMAFAPNSKYQTDLNSVFRSLTSKAATTTSATTMENTAYGLFLCRGDLTTAACQDCVATACLDLSQSYCPLNKVAVIWYTRCMVRYSNESFFGKMDDSPKALMWNRLNLTRNQTKFKQVLFKTMDDLAMHTSNNNTFYAYAHKSFGFWGVTAHSQCTPDLTPSDCTRCLKVAVGQMPVSITGRVLQPSCNLFYHVYKSNVNLSKIKYPYGKNNHSIEVIVATLAPVASMSIAVLILCLIIQRAKAKKLKTAARNADDDCVDVESLRYDLATIISATNNFSSNIGRRHYKSH
ncbi:hypothetical protein vseg_006040 [Gypsophila vaccaria]